jgi:hypothetical protein
MGPPLSCLQSSRTAEPHRDAPRWAEGPPMESTATAEILSRQGLEGRSPGRLWNRPAGPGPTSVSLAVPPAQEDAPSGQGTTVPLVVRSNQLSQLLRRQVRVDFEGNQCLGLRH